MKISFIFPNLRGELIANIGLAYLMSITELNHKTSLIDPTFYRGDWKKYVEWKVKKEKPEVIAASCLTFNYYDALKIVAYIKQILPNVKTIFGGIHPTLLPEEVLSNHLVDAVCIGEGEDTIIDYLDCLEKGKSLSDVKGIWFKENGLFIRNRLRPLIKNLDSLTNPNWDLWEISKYLKIPPHMKTIEMLGSRGCPYSCTYCSNYILRKILPGKYVRFRSPQNIIDEILVLKEKYWKKGFRFIYFWDEIFGLNKRNLEEFCSLYIQEGLHEEIFWTCNNRADLVTTEWAQLVKKAGCYLVRMGIEAGNERIRNIIYQKNISTQKIVNASKILKQNDILTRFNLILGGPGENITTMNESVQIVDQLKPESFFFSIFQPLPKTAILEKIKDLQGKIAEVDWQNNPDFWNKCIIDFPNLKSKDVEKFKQKITIKYMWQFFWQGLSMRRLTFFKDVLKFIISIKPRYHILLQYLMVYTIRRYQIDDWIKRNIKKSSGGKP